MHIALLVLASCLIPSGLVMVFASWGARLEISRAAPDYAARLYQPVADQLLFGFWPLRTRVLFREPVPPQIATTVRMLRRIYATHWVLLVLLVGCLLALAVSSVAA